MKNFVSMTHTIRKYDEKVGHSAATVDFIDVEFSNNTGRASRCNRSKSAWKKNRFNSACRKAAKILEDRYIRSAQHSIATDHTQSRGGHHRSTEPSHCKVKHGIRNISNDRS